MDVSFSEDINYICGEWWTKIIMGEYYVCPMVYLMNKCLIEKADEAYVLFKELNDRSETIFVIFDALKFDGCNACNNKLTWNPCSSYGNGTSLSVTVTQCHNATLENNISY